MVVGVAPDQFQSVLRIANSGMKSMACPIRTFGSLDEIGSGFVIWSVLWRNGKLHPEEFRYWLHHCTCQPAAGRRSQRS